MGFCGLKERGKKDESKIAREENMERGRLKGVEGMALIRRILCFLGIHLRAVKTDDGIHCIDCGYFKSKAEHQADLHAGGGW